MDIYSINKDQTLHPIVSKMLQMDKKTLLILDDDELEGLIKAMNHISSAFKRISNDTDSIKVFGDPEKIKQQTMLYEHMSRSFQEFREAK